MLINLLIHMYLIIILVMGGILELQIAGWTGGELCISLSASGG